MLSRLKKTWLALLRRARAERELDEELRYHAEQQTEQNIRLGMNPEEARCAALRVGAIQLSPDESRPKCREDWFRVGNTERRVCSVSTA
jgi:hypothetical protein